TIRGNFLESFSLMIGLILGLIAIGFGILMAVTITRSIVRPLSTAVDVATAIAAGDLSQQIGAHGTDETGVLLDAMEDMQGRLSKLVQQVQALVKAANDGDFTATVDTK